MNIIEAIEQMKLGKKITHPKIFPIYYFMDNDFIVEDSKGARVLDIAMTHIFSDQWRTHQTQDDIIQELQSTVKHLMDRLGETESNDLVAIEPPSFNIEISPQVLRETKIIDTSLPTRLKNCLMQENIYTICDLLEKTENEICRLNNFGNLSRVQLKKFLDAHNLKLRVC